MHVKVTKILKRFAKTENWNEKKLLQFYFDAINLNKVKDWEFNSNLKENIINLGTDANFTRLIKLVYISFSLIVGNPAKKYKLSVTQKIQLQIPRIFAH